MGSEKIRYGENHGICGILNGNGSEKIVIIGHGFGSSKESGYSASIAKILESLSIDSFRYDMYGHGESDGKKQEITISRTVKDINDTISLCNKLGYKKIGLIGNSFSGMASIICTSQNNLVSLLGLQSPAIDYRKLSQKRFTDKGIKLWEKQGFIDYQIPGDENTYRLDYKFYEDLFKFDVISYAKTIKVPTYILHGENDAIIGIDDAIQLHENINGSEIKILKGQGHHVMNPDDAYERIKSMKNFINANL